MSDDKSATDIIDSPDIPARRDFWHELLGCKGPPPTDRERALTELRLAHLELRRALGAPGDEWIPLKA